MSKNIYIAAAFLVIILAFVLGPIDFIHSAEKIAKDEIAREKQMYTYSDTITDGTVYKRKLITQSNAKTNSYIISIKKYNDNSQKWDIRDLNVSKEIYVNVKEGDYYALTNDSSIQSVNPK